MFGRVYRVWGGRTLEQASTISNTKRTSENGFKNANILYRQMNNERHRSHAFSREFGVSFCCSSRVKRFGCVSWPCRVADLIYD
jgi:hypothetical protein